MPSFRGLEYVELPNVIIELIDSFESSFKVRPNLVGINRQKE